jgi:hypothetical protein
MERLKSCRTEYARVLQHHSRDRGGICCSGTLAQWQKTRAAILDRSAFLVADHRAFG